MRKLLLQISFLRRRLITILCKIYLGKDFTPLDRVPDELGCAEAVTTLLKTAGAMPYVIAGTWTLNNYLARSRDWTLVHSPEPGDVVISPTGLSNYGGKAPFVGHVGIMGDRNLIYANNSDNGKWSTIYSLSTWHDRYGRIGGYPVFYYRFTSLL